MATEKRNLSNNCCEDKISTLAVHGVKYIRTGQCNRCGECEKSACPHFAFINGLASCSVYDKREKICESCTNTEGGMWYRKGKPITHAVCCSFPDQPFLRVIKEGICGFKFGPATEADAKRHKELVEAWQ